MLEVRGPQRRLRREPGAVGRLPRGAGGRAWCASWGATGWARPRCSSPSWGSCPCARGASPSTGPTSAAGGPRSGRPAASATCPRAARSSRTSPCRRTCAWACSGAGARGGQRRAATRSSDVFELFPKLEAAPRPQGRRPLGRRAAAARHRARAPGAPEAPPDGRAHRGHPALGHRPDRGRHRADQGAGHRGAPRRAVPRIRLAPGLLLRHHAQGHHRVEGRDRRTSATIWSGST